MVPLIFLFSSLVAALTPHGWISGEQSLLGLVQENVDSNTPPWQTMPRPPPLPDPTYSGTAKVNGIDLWYATFGADLEESTARGYSPLVFLHGGFANIEYFAHQIHYLKGEPYTLIAVDSRAQGRSSDDTSRPITYDLMTEDTIALMDYLEVDRFSTIGWSDGGCISFNLAMNYSSRIDRIFSFGGTYSYTCINETALDADTFKTYITWVEEDFNRNSPSAGSFEDFEDRMMQMWSTEPLWNAKSFSKIPTLYEDPHAPMFWIVAGDSEEAVTLKTPHDLHAWIPGSSLVMLPAVSHFGFLQDPGTFNVMLKRFMEIDRWT